MELVIDYYTKDKNSSFPEIYHLTITEEDLKKMIKKMIEDGHFCSDKIINNIEIDKVIL